MKSIYLSSETRYGHKFANYAKYFREISLEVDKEPNLINHHLSCEAIQFLLTDMESNCVTRTRYLEALAYGDPGVLLASPGPSLSGLMMRELATTEQCQWFYKYIDQQKASTFFALTEPNVGSNASLIQAHIKLIADKTYELNATKCLFGNGAVANLGIILVRQHPGPLGIVPVLITPDLLKENENYFERHSLSMFGLRGARLGLIKFNQFKIPQNAILGQHKHIAEQGMMAIIKTFNKLRTGVGALAIGQAQAVLDHVISHYSRIAKSNGSSLRAMYFHLNCARETLLNAAAAVDKNSFMSTSVAHAKVQATTLACKLINKIIDILPDTILVENAWMAKAYRDCFAWEYMEGTRFMQYLNILPDIRKNYFNHGKGGYKHVE